MTRGLYGREAGLSVLFAVSFWTSVMVICWTILGRPVSAGKQLSRRSRDGSPLLGCESYWQSQKKEDPVLRLISYGGVDGKEVARTTTAVTGKDSIVIVSIVFFARLSPFSTLISFRLTMLKTLAVVGSRNVEIGNSGLDRTGSVGICVGLSILETLSTRPCSQGPALRILLQLLERAATRVSSGD